MCMVDILTATSPSASVVDKDPNKLTTPRCDGNELARREIPQLSAAPRASMTANVLHSLRESVSPIIGQTNEAFNRDKVALGEDFNATRQEVLEQFPGRRLQQEGLVPSLVSTLSQSPLGGIIPQTSADKVAAIAPSLSPTEAKVVAGTLNGVRDFGLGLTSPLGFATTGAGMLPRAAKMVVGAGLTYAGARHVATAVPGGIEKLNKGEIEEGTRELVGGISTAAFLTTAGVKAIKAARTTTAVANEGATTTIGESPKTAKVAAPVETQLSNARRPIPGNNVDELPQRVTGENRLQPSIAEREVNTSFSQTTPRTSTSPLEQQASLSEATALNAKLFERYKSGDLSPDVDCAELASMIAKNPTGAPIKGARFLTFFSLQKQSTSRGAPQVEELRIPLSSNDARPCLPSPKENFYHTVVALQDPATGKLCVLDPRASPNPIPINEYGSMMQRMNPEVSHISSVLADITPLDRGFKANGYKSVTR